jgi:RecA-family ATPase
MAAREVPFPEDELDASDPRYLEAKRKKEQRKAKANGHHSQVEPLEFMDYTIEPIPRRAWVVQDRVPANNVTLLSGEGSVGKSILAMQLSVVVALNADQDTIERDWLGQLPAGGSVLYLTCEEDRDETAHRLEAIAKHYHTSRKELMRNLFMISRVGLFSLLAEVSRETLRPTELWALLRAQIIAIKPKLIVIDTAADVFGGNEINRQHTRQFITMLRGLAIEVGAGVILIAHPSLEGIRSGSGLSGSTAWHNSVRARAYFQNLSEDERDNDLRVLEWMKSNYGPVCERVVVRYKNGVYVPEPSQGSAEQLMSERNVEGVLLEILRRFARDGRDVSSKPSPSYLPAVFAREAEAKNAKPPIRKSDLEGAMSRLFTAGRIVNEAIGPPSRRLTRIVEKGSASASD